MKLNIDLIIDFMRKDFSIVKENVKHEDPLLEQVLLITSGEELLKGGKIYVADGRKLPQKPLLKGACSVISIGEAPENYMKANCDYVELSEDVDISEVVNTIQEAYDIYGKWEERLNNIINNGNDVQKLLDVTLPLLDNPIYLHDKDFHFVAHAEVPGMPGGKDIYGIEKNGGRFSLKSINELKDTPDFEETFKTTRPTFHMDTGECPYIYDNVRINGEYWGRLFVDERNKSFAKGDFILIMILREKIEYVLSRQNGHKLNGLKLIEEEIKRMLDTESINFNVVESEMDNLGWDRNNSYICFQIRLDTIDIKLNTKVNICENIELKVNNSLVFPYRQCVVGLVYIDGHEDEKKTLVKLAKYLQAFKLHVGISQIFGDFYEFQTYYKQTEIAIEYGIREQSDKWIHFFEEFSFAYMLDCCLGKFNPETFYPSGLVKIMDHDREKTTSYTDTLRVYLENDLSPARTMKELYVQRSTLLYRLERINEIADTNLKDPNTKLHYMLAFALHDRWEEREQLGLYQENEERLDGDE